MLKINPCKSCDTKPELSALGSFYPTYVIHCCIGHVMVQGLPIEEGKTKVISDWNEYNPIKKET